jgi:NADH:ubiquinone oxidoreductase subunit F (NADH-binding)
MTATVVESSTTRLLRGLPVRGALSLAQHLEQWGALPARSVPGVDESLIVMIEASGLTGRGGAGFPTGRKMRTVAASDRVAIVVGNGAEGEPASAKDTLLMTRAPHLVLDGLQIAARAVGADEAHLVVHRGGIAATLRESAAQRSGDDVLLTVHELPVRYVASEETAIVSWLNGRDAKPTFTPPRPYESGVRRRPTLVNNVETLAQLGLIGRYGADWFRSVGDASEPGTMLLTVRGAGAPGTVMEVATGSRIGDVLVAAGIDQATSSAVLVGGYFGSWLATAYAAQLPLTHQALRGAGSALGAGVLAALPASSCGVAETARVMEYLAAQSAGQCGPCLNGLPAIAGAMRSLASGRITDVGWASLERWLDVVPGRGACRHPDGATRLVANTLATFAGDVAAHRAGHPCAGVAAAPWLPIPKTSPVVWR